MEKYLVILILIALLCSIARDAIVIRRERKRITQQPNEPLEKYMERVGRPISETFPQYLERVGAIKPKFELSEELKAKYGSFGDIPRLHIRTNSPQMDYFGKPNNHETFPLDKNGNGGC